jgi:hypothetical protein
VAVFHPTYATRCVKHDATTSNRCAGSAINTKRCRANAPGEALGDDLGAVTGASLDKGVELDALAKLPKDESKEPKIAAVD